MIGYRTTREQLSQLEARIKGYLKRHSVDWKPSVSITVSSTLLGVSSQKGEILLLQPFLRHPVDEKYRASLHVMFSFKWLQVEDGSVSGPLNITIGVSHLKTWMDSDVSTAKGQLIHVIVKYMQVRSQYE